jgi:putative addiction module killer protein
LKAKAKILFRIQKLELDEHFGDCEPVGDGIRELKVNFAKGYRIYFKEIYGKIIVLLIGGDKSTHQRDIEDNRGKVGSSIFTKTNFVIAVENMGPAKLEKASQLKVPIISEDDFLGMIGN